MADKKVPTLELKASSDVQVLTPELVSELKSKYPKGIYKTVIMDEPYIWRPLFRDEYGKIVNNQDIDILDKEEIIVETCLLFPKLSIEKIKQLDAGIPTTLSENIMSKSGFEASAVEKL